MRAHNTVPAFPIYTKQYGFSDLILSIFDKYVFATSGQKFVRSGKSTPGRDGRMQTGRRTAIRTAISRNFQDTRLRLNEAAEYCVGVRCPQTFLSPFHGFSALGFPNRFCIFCLSYSGLLVRLCTSTYCPYRHSFFFPPAATLLSVIPQHTGPHLCKSFSAFYLFQEWFVRRRIPDPCRSCPLPASPFFPRPPYEQEIFPPRIKKSTKLSFSPLHTDNLCAIITFVCLYGVALALHIEPGVPCDSRTTALPAHVYH